MKRIAPLLVLLPLAACSKADQAQPTTVPSGDVAPASTEPVEPVPTDAASAAETASRISHYTSFKNCRVVKSNENEDWSVSRCAGPAGMGLIINYGDAREDLELLRPGKKPRHLGLGGMGFNGFGDTAEWRGNGAGAAFAPTSLIVRNYVSEDPEDSSRQTAYLVVIDLTQGCAVAKLKPGAGQNERAREIADAARQPCLADGS